MLRTRPRANRRTGFTQRTGPERPEWNCGNPLVSLGAVAVPPGGPTKGRRCMSYDLVRAECLAARGAQPQALGRDGAATPIVKR